MDRRDSRTRALILYSITVVLVAVAVLVVTGMIGLPVGAAVAALLLSMISMVAGRWFAPRSSWLWRLGAASSDQFVVRHPVGDVIDEVGAVVRRRNGWRLVAADAEGGTARVRAASTGWTWMRQIDIEARPASGGALVTVWSCSPQLYDWGDNRRTVAALRDELGRRTDP